MLELVSSQSECNRAFRRWVSALTTHTTFKKYGWVIEGKGVVFANYGRGDFGKIDTQVMLGADPEFGDGVVKIVQPKAARLDKGPTTVIGRDEKNHVFLLREGRLQRNNLSRFVKDDFAELSELTETPLIVAGERSARRWYVVADLNAEPELIVAQTASFANACAKARNRAGGGTTKKNEDQETREYGMDEKGRIVTVERTGGTAEIVALQGYVFEELKRKVGKELRKPKRNGYCVDGFVERANLLIEIKTSTSANSIYDAVGQLKLYPHLIGITSSPAAVLLLPDEPPLKPVMAAALEAAQITVFTYNIGDSGDRPKLEISPSLIDRCRQHER